MRHLLPLFICSFFAFFQLSAEGTKQVAPNSEITIMGTQTTDIAALHIGNTNFNNFASYSNSDPNSRLYINVNDPSTECILLGFSQGHPNQTPPPPAAFEYRIKDPNGNIVYGPILIDGNANITDWSQAANGPNAIVGSGGYDAMVVSPTDLMSSGWTGKGDYYIEFNAVGNLAGLLIDFWDITVADCSAPAPVAKSGRVWSFNWSFFAVNDFGFPNRPFNGSFYVCSPDPVDPESAFVTLIDFNGSGFRPAAFNVAFNSFGSQNTGDIMVDRRSRESINSTQSEYAIFLNDPVDICKTAEPGTIDLLGISRCGENELNIKYIASKNGQFDLLLDFDGQDGMYTEGTADIIITQEVDPTAVGQISCIAWDGLDGLGNSVASTLGANVPMTISFAQGVYHFPIFDAEFMDTGFRVFSVRPAGDEPLLYYDDSEISVLSGTGEPVVQFNGCTLPCHGWSTFIAANTPGFGNLNTINSWWFSQRITQDEVFNIPPYFECQISGPASICEGATTSLNVSVLSVPMTNQETEIVGIEWTGPSIVGANDLTTISVGEWGPYTAIVKYSSEIGDTCETTCTYMLDLSPAATAQIDTLILTGEVVVINSTEYNTGGTYQQNLIAANGCDSILTINVVELQTVVHYSLDDCRSYPDDSSDINYSEFQAVYPNPLSCATIVADSLHRVFPEINKHSCTPGVNNTPAICVSSSENCSFGNDNNDLSLYFEVTITPAADTAVALTELSFYERAPQNFSWVDGATGLNNPPTLYGVRVLKDGMEILRMEDVATTGDWSFEQFSFLDNPDFYITETTTFRFELLGYCLFGNMSNITAWDLDEISVQASCVSPGSIGQSLSGVVNTSEGISLEGVEIELSRDVAFVHSDRVLTDATGVFNYMFLSPDKDYYIQASRNTDYLEGVSTLDLINMQKHLLGVKPFTKNQEWIAADVNRSNSITTLDLLEVKKLLLGLQNEFPNNSSWRLGEAENLMDGNDLWNFDAPRIVDLSMVDPFVSFVGVKVGDVNGTTSQLNTHSTRSNNVHLNLQFADKKVQAGEAVIVEFSSESFEDIIGFQMGLKVNGAEVVGLSEGKLELNNQHASRSRDQSVNISWYNLNQKNINPGEVLFGLILIPNENAKLSELIELNSGRLSNEAYKGEALQQIGIRLSEKVSAY